MLPLAPASISSCVCEHESTGSKRKLCSASRCTIEIDLGVETKRKPLACPPCTKQRTIVNRLREGARPNSDLLQSARADFGEICSNHNCSGPRPCTTCYQTHKVGSAKTSRGGVDVRATSEAYATRGRDEWNLERSRKSKRKHSPQRPSLERLRNLTRDDTVS